VSCRQIIIDKQIGLIFVPCLMTDHTVNRLCRASEPAAMADNHEVGCEARYAVREAWEEWSRGSQLGFQSSQGVCQGAAGS